MRGCDIESRLTRSQDSWVCTPNQVQKKGNHFRILFARVNGWLGTPLQHETFPGLTVQSCCQVWLKIEPPKILFWGWAMPEIVATDLKLLEVD